jgi:hypothetical protein
MCSFVVHATHDWKAYQVYFLTQQTEHLLDFQIKMVDLLKAAQKLKRHARTPRDFTEAKPIGLPLPQVVTCAHSLLGELFSSINITNVLLQNLGFA